MKKIKVYIELAIGFSIFLLLFYITPQAQVLKEAADTVLAVTTFLFAILLAFSTANRHQRLSSLKRALRDDDARILSSYQIIKSFGKNTTDTYRKLLDEYLIAQLDYYLVDYRHSTSKFLEAYNFIVSLRPKNDILKAHKTLLLEEMNVSLNNQKKVIFLVGERMRFFEWISLYVLLFIIIVTLSSLNNHTLLVMVILSALSTTFMLTLLVLRDLDNLSWGEKSWVWDQISELFLELDLTPYYIEDLFTSGRLSKKDVAHLKEYRLVKFPSPYPIVEDKIVSVVKNDL